MLQECPFPRGTYATDFIQRIGAESLRPAFAMTADGKSVRFIPQALQEI